MPDGKPLLIFETPSDGVPVKCDCGGYDFNLLIHAKLAGQLVTRWARCIHCQHTEPIDEEPVTRTPGR